MKYAWFTLAFLALILVVVWLNINKPPKTSSPTSSTAPVKISAGGIPNIPFKLAPEFVIHTFASNLGAPRDLQFSPDGTLLVSNPFTGEVIALPDKNQDNVADENKVIIKEENIPHGLAFYQGKLYVAEATQVVRFNWDEASLTATKDKVLFNLPQNNNHNRRTIVFDKNGKMFVSVGSTCNVCNESSALSATILISDADGNNPKVYAKGLRNAPFLAFNPQTEDLWVTEMGRDNLGDNLPPDEINIIKQDKDYGWPNCYGSKLVDTNFNPQAQCQNTQPPIYEIPAHSAPLGLTFIQSTQFPPDWQGDLLVSYHGSWNRSTPIGYKVVHLKVSDNIITQSEDFLTGFLPSSVVNGPNDALGRPVDLTFDNKGNLYLSDDKAGKVYIVQKL